MDRRLTGTAQWVEEGSEAQRALMSDGYEATSLRKLVGGEWWTVLMVRVDE